MIELTHEPIDPASLLAHVSSPSAGAVVLFLGVTRGVTDGRETSSLDYECYPQMARGKLQELVDQAHSRWPLQGCAVVHRLGHLQPQEASVAVAVSSAHRAEAFLAGQWLIDTLKEVVPIWKKENWSDGREEWVHPGLVDAATSTGESDSSSSKTSKK